MAPVDLSNAQMRDKYRSLVAALQVAVDAGDDAAFRGAFEQLRESLSLEFMPELKRLTASACSLRITNVS